MNDIWIWHLGALVVAWLVGLVTGLGIRVGREREAELRGIAIGRRRPRLGPPHPADADPARPWSW